MADRPFSLLTRRRVLGLTLSGGALLGSGVGGALFLRGAAAEVSGLKVLSAHGYRTMAMLAECAFPELLPGGLLAGKLDLARAFDSFLADESPATQREAKQALVLLEFGPLIFERRLSTFSHLDPAERLAHFERWAASNSGLRRQVALGFRQFLAMLFYDTPEVWPSIGYDGPLIKQAAP